MQVAQVRTSIICMVPGTGTSHYLVFRVPVPVVSTGKPSASSTYHRQEEGWKTTKKERSVLPGWVPVRMNATAPGISL